MRYVLDGDPKAVAKVLQENRVRVGRGVITITPLPDEGDVEADTKDAELADSKAEPEADTKDAELADSKAAPASDTKETRRSKKSE